MTKIANLKQTIGDTKIIPLVFRDSNGDFLDITGSTVYLTVKTNIDDTDANAVFQKIVTSHTDPTNGATTIEVEPSDTSSEEPSEPFYDIQITQSTGKISTVMTGNYVLTRQITNT